MRSAHSVSLQIYVFPFTCFAFSLFFCHFVSPSPSLPPSRAPYCAASSRGAPRGRRGEIGAPFRSPTSALRLARCARSQGGGLHLIDADVYVGTAGWGGEVLFRLAPLSSFPLILFCLALCTAIAYNCTRGVLALCVQYFVDASALRQSLERCRRGQRVGVGATAENTGATARKRGAFRTALLVRFREASTSRVVEPCRRRAQEEVERHGRERDKCRAKT